MSYLLSSKNLGVLNELNLYASHNERIPPSQSDYPRFTLMLSSNLFDFQEVIHKNFMCSSCLLQPNQISSPSSLHISHNKVKSFQTEHKMYSSSDFILNLVSICYYCTHMLIYLNIQFIYTRSSYSFASITCT